MHTFCCTASEDACAEFLGITGGNACCPADLCATCTNDADCGDVSPWCCIDKVNLLSLCRVEGRLDAEAPCLLYGGYYATVQ